MSIEPLRCRCCWTAAATTEACGESIGVVAVLTPAEPKGLLLLPPTVLVLLLLLLLLLLL